MKKKLLLGIFVFFLVNLTLGLVKNKEYGKVMAEEPGNPPPFYGMIFAGAGDFSRFKEWGINLVETSFDYSASESNWAGVYEAAIANGIKLIPLLWYEPDTVWTQNFEAGRPFLNFLKANPRYLEATYALYAFHEPYRYFTPNDLRQVYVKIKTEVSSLKVFCDGCTDSAAQSGDPRWMQPDIADGGHHGFYPFASGGNTWEINMSYLNRLNQTIEDNNLPFEVFVYAQTFRGVSPWDKMPNAEELREITQRTFNSSLMKNNHVIGYAWYTWQGGPYSDYLVNHSELYSVVREVYDTYFAGGPILTPTPSQEHCPRKPQGDANCDGNIDGIDYSMWLNSQCRSSSTQSCADTRADFNNDSNIDDEDYEIWFENRG